MSREPSTSYIIKGGAEGRARLGLIARVLAGPTAALLDRVEPLAGRTVVDAGCGGGDVSFELARRVGPRGRVVGIDLDDGKLAIARAEATRAGLHHVEFRHADVLHPWPVERAQLVHVRFVLTHLADPAALLERARLALSPGGVITVEDIDYGGQFCDPPSPAFDRYGELYVKAARHRGGDPFIGRRLVRLLEEAGFADVEAMLVQPFGRDGDIKQITSLTLDAIGDTLVTTGIASRAEVTQVTTELKAYADRPDTMMSFPQIFQAWGRRH